MKKNNIEHNPRRGTIQYFNTEVYSFHIRAFTTLFIFSLIMMVTACNRTADGNAETAGSDEYYTCSMDPQVISAHDGMCPICHMKLIKVKKNQLGSGQIQLSKQQIKLANITYDTARIQEMTKDITLTGKVTVDQNRVSAISARVQGRIEKLYVKTVGDYLHAGDILYTIYSEELIAAQSEYITALSKPETMQRFVEAASRKLTLLGMDEQLLRKLKETKQVLIQVPVYSGSEGFITEIPVTEGGYVTTGTTVLRLASLASLWVEAQVYLPYLAYLKEGTEADFFIPSAGETPFKGQVIFIDPQVQSPNRYVLARFRMVSPSAEIKPGMMAHIILQTEKKNALVLPLDAILQNSHGANVWIRKGGGIFENRGVETGMQNNRQIEITRGLEAGEVAVITGTYLLNSEYVFKRGSNPAE